MAKPKLALVPSAQGSKFYSVLPSSGVGDFDFTRSGSATRINSQGLIETVGNGVSRLNYPLIDGKVVGCPSHLLEPQSTNLLPYSEDFENSDWTNSSVGTTPILTTGFISPDGSLNAYKISNANQNSFWKSETTTIGASDSRSIYARTVSGTGTAQLLSHNSNTNNTFFLTEEWQRFEVSSTTSSAGNTTFYAVDFRGSGTLSEILVWGAQSEANSFPTSYIPTNGSSVTRSAETANGSGDAATFNDSEGVLMAEISALVDDTSFKFLGISDGSTSNRINIAYVGTSNTIETDIIVGGALQTNINHAVPSIIDFHKVAVKYSLNNISLWIDGIEVNTDNASLVFPLNTLNTFAFNSAIGGAPFYGSVKQIQYFDSVLNDSDLETLTSWVSFSDMAEGQLYSVE